MAGGGPAVATHLDDDQDDLEAESHHQSTAGSYQDRSVTEIETSFSEHFIPTVEDGDETPVNSDEFSSLEMNLLPSLQHHTSFTTMQLKGNSKDNDGAVINPVPYSNSPVTNTYLVNDNTNTSAIIDKPSENDKQDEDDEEESKSTTLGAVSKISFRKTFCPVFQKKSFESDSILGLTTESGSESINCDSAIESEANNVADNIFQDNIENNVDPENSETFLVSASSDTIVALKDFAFDKQENYFQVPGDLKIPLDIPKTQMLDIPLKETFTSRSSKTFEDLSLIEEITEHSSISTIKSREVTPRSFEQSLNPLQEEENRSVISQPEEICHKPKILQKTYSFESPRSINSKINRVRSDFDVTLPSKSNPATPREDKDENEVKENIKTKKFAQNKPKIVAKRYQRSPPRETKSEVGTGSVPKPIQTKTGLILTQPVKDENERVLGKRSASSASLILRNSPQPLNRQISKSTENIPRLIPQYRKEKYDHVESKVKKYIEDAKKMKANSRSKELSRSCSNLLKQKNVVDIESRPRTADASLRSREEPAPNKTLRKSISKSETNLKRSKHLATPSNFSKSSFSIGHIGAIYDTSEEEDLTQLTAIYNGDDLSTKAESLLDLVAKERKSKQEAKKVINELQTSYDDLLQKYAAAENALDKVRFGIKPKEDGSRQEAFTMAEKIAEKIAHYHLEETKDAKQRKRVKSSKLNVDIQTAKDKLVGLSNQVSGLFMSVQCNMVTNKEAMEAVSEVEANLTNVSRRFGCEENSELAALYLDARKSLEELKLQLKQSYEAENIRQDEADTPSFLASIQKVSDWQKSLPPPSKNPNISSCYGSGSLPTSPTSPDQINGSHFESFTNPTNKTLEVDSGCPGSDRSTLWLSYLQSRRMSPSTRSNSKSKENISTSLYNLEEESLSVSPKNQVLNKSDNSSSVTPRDIVNINNDFVRSITIERKESAIEILATSTPKQQDICVNNYYTDDSTDFPDENKTENPGDVPSTPAKTLKRLDTCKNLFPGVESHDLAQQIDNEILELRNFFDDHREEMMYLLHGNKDEQDLVRNTSLPFFDNSRRPETMKSKSLMNIRPYSDQFPESDRSTPDLPDPANFNFQEDTNSRDSYPVNSGQEMFRSLQDWRTNRDESESDFQQDATLRIRKLEFEKRRKKKERQRRRHFVANVEEINSQRKPSIHSFFPSFDQSLNLNDKDNSLDDCNDIPRLNLSDLTSEVTAPDMSMISEAFSEAAGNYNHPPPDSGCFGAEIFSNNQKTSRSIACDTLDLNRLPKMKCPTSTQTTPGKINASTTSSDNVMNKSLPLLQTSAMNLLDIPMSAQKVIIIKESECKHSQKPQKLKSKKNKKKNKELKELLLSLDSAAMMAEKLKKRSENLLETLNQDLIIEK